jgi:interleukin-1 receptor-associated kinase 1
VLITLYFAPFQYDVHESEQGIEESNAYEEAEIFPDEDTDESDEIQSSRNISEKTAKLMVQVT